MTDVVIRIENLGKRYRYGGVAPLSDSLRADIVDWMKGLFRPGRNGHPSFRDVHEQHLDSDPRYFWALKNINLEIKQGEVVGIIGRNGAGKSTLLKILSRITPPTTGSITYRGRIASLLEVGTGFHRELTGRENIYLNGSILGMTRREITAKLDEIVAFAEIEKFLDTPVKFYSSGMYVRLAFAVAAHLDPEILVVDEVLAVGDANFQKKCLGKMGEVAKAGRTVIFVSHQLSMIRTLCSRCVWLATGEIQEVGSPENVVAHYLEATAGSGQAVIHATFPRDESKAGQILEARLEATSGRPPSHWDVFDQITFEVRYIIRKTLAGAAIQLVMERNGEILMVSFDTDADATLLDHRQPGLYRARVRLPTPLKSGRYEVTLGLCIPNHAGIDNHHRALVFYINDLSFDSSLRSYGASRPGVIAAHLPWTTTLDS